MKSRLLPWLSRSWFLFTHTDKVAITGEALAVATVSQRTGVSPGAFTPLARAGAWYAGTLGGDNSGGPAWLSSTLKVGLDTTPPFEHTLTGHAYLPPAQEALAHDADGNLLSDGRWDYTWDAENRLIQMQTNATALAIGVPGVRVRFGYDAQSRRVSKTSETLSATGTWVKTADLRYLWSGWTLLAEATLLDPTTKQPLTALQVTRAYSWGLDIASSFTATGNTGALNAIIDYRYPNAQGKPAVLGVVPDANGNIIALADLSTGSLLARYDYDAFGTQIIAHTTPAMAASENLRLAVEENDWGFSTKQRDRETGLCYYGFRYYSPELGRWLSRDPIGERGGRNLYGMVGNDAVNQWDYLGLKGIKVETDPKYNTVGDCGEHAVYFKVTLDEPAPEDGYIIQEMDFSWENLSCTNPPQKLDGDKAHFWEAWDVKKGETEWSVQGWRRQNGMLEWTDKSGKRTPFAAPCHGKISAKGHFKFFPKSTTGNLGKIKPGKDNYEVEPPEEPGWDAGNKPGGNGHPNSGVGPSTKTEPKYWKNNAPDGDRSVEASWDCCNGKAKTVLKVSP